MVSRWQTTPVKYWRMILGLIRAALATKAYNVFPSSSYDLHLNKVTNHEVPAMDIKKHVFSLLKNLALKIGAKYKLIYF